jgi:hypothetical protein
VFKLIKRSKNRRFRNNITIGCIDILSKAKEHFGQSVAPPLLAYVRSSTKVFADDCAHDDRKHRWIPSLEKSIAPTAAYFETEHGEFKKVIVGGMKFTNDKRPIGVHP